MEREKMPTAPTLPFWFRLRQGKAEPAGADTYRLTAPNLGEAYIGIRPAEHCGWLAVLKTSPDGPDVAVAGDPSATVPDAWEAAFELYRVHLVI